jgi:hypothetical protein
VIGELVFKHSESATAWKGGIHLKTMLEPEIGPGHRCYVKNQVIFVFFSSTRRRSPLFVEKSFKTTKYVNLANIGYAVINSHHLKVSCMASI